MHKILKKTIKYGAAVLLTLIAVILTGIGYLYLSADMMTPQFASTPETDRVIRKDSLRQYGGNYLRHSESGLWELKVSGPAYERGKAIGQLTSDLLYFQEKVFVDQIKEIVPSESYLKFLRFFIVLFNRNLGKMCRKSTGTRFMASPSPAPMSMISSAPLRASVELPLRSRLGTCHAGLHAGRMQFICLLG